MAGCCVGELNLIDIHGFAKLGSQPSNEKLENEASM